MENIKEDRQIKILWVLTNILGKLADASVTK